MSDEEKPETIETALAKTTMRLANCRALLSRAEDLIRGTPDVNRTRAQRDLLFDIEAMKERC